MKNVIFLSLFLIFSFGVNFLHVNNAYAEVELCNLEKTAKAEVGYECRVKTQNGKVIWQLYVKTASGKKVWEDTKSGLLVSDILDERYTHHQAEQMCTNPSSLDARGNLASVNWSLPTGYPKSLNGEYDFPNKDSDFETLEANGVRKVIDMRRRYFLSSSVDPNSSDFAYVFYGNNGDIDNYNRGVSGGSVLCVGR